MPTPSSWSSRAQPPAATAWSRAKPERSTRRPTSMALSTDDRATPDHTSTRNAVLAAEDQFFGALLTADRTSLSSVLGDDFLLVDVMAGSEVPREALVDLVGSRLLIFDRVDRE